MADNSECRTSPYCSFCGKGKDQVVCLIAGPHAYICDACVGICVSYLPPRSRLNALATILLPWKWRFHIVKTSADAGGA